MSGCVPPSNRGTGQGFYEMDWRYVVFWCRDCDRCYCIDHWKIDYSDDDPMCSEWGSAHPATGKFLTTESTSPANSHAPHKAAIPPVMRSRFHPEP
jgi:hypothetical protein